MSGSLTLTDVTFCAKSEEVSNSFFKSKGVDLWMDVWACLLVTQPWKLSHCWLMGRGSGGFKGSRDAGYAFAFPGLSAPLPRHTFHTLASRSLRSLSVARQESKFLHRSRALKPRVQTFTSLTWWLSSSFKANPLNAKSVGTVVLNDTTCLLTPDNLFPRFISVQNLRKQGWQESLCCVKLWKRKVTVSLADNKRMNTK